MIYTVLMISEVLLSISIITLVLMQHGKGADAGAAFGSGASGTVFGSRGAGNFLTRTTAILATLFFLNCLALAYIVSYQAKNAGGVESVIDKIETVSPKAPVDNAPAIDIPAVDVPAIKLDGGHKSMPASDVPE